MLYLNSDSGKRALVAISGGVDSAATAAIMKQNGYDCTLATMALFCLSETDRNDAVKTAQALSLPHRFFELSGEFEDKVIRPFVKCYEAGITPNPCIDCNREIKFGELVRYADSLGCEIIATGHYARVEKCGERYLLKTARDSSKDQSYMLYSLGQDILKRLRLPLGDMTKAEAREIARKVKLTNADKKDSQDICFVPDGDYAAFIEKYTGKTYPEGDFVTEDGRVLGRHKGIIRYTVGQRKGLGLALPAPMYVMKKDISANKVVLCDDRSLYTDTLFAKDFNWIAFDMPPESFEASAKTRYRAPPERATVTPITRERVKIVFKTPVRAITAGQACVLYDGDTVIGGGTIE